MHQTFQRNINSAVNYFSASEEREEELEFQIANFHAGEQAKRGSRRARYRDNDRDPEGEAVLQAPVWDGPPPDPDAKQLWQTVLDSMQQRLPRPIYETWLTPTIGIAVERGDVDVLVVSAPTQFAAEWLESRMWNGLQTELRLATGKPMELRLTVTDLPADDGSTEGVNDKFAKGGEHDA